MTTARIQVARRLPIGAEPIDGRVHFRVWAPKHHRVGVVVVRGAREACAPLEEEEGAGYHAGFIDGAAVGDRYWFDTDAGRFPDPASRFQPEGPHGPSEIIDPGAFRWTDQSWGGIDREGQVIYEMHVGTFTTEGTWRAAIAHLSDLAALGVTLLEVMPVADFSGEFGWGYDGVDLFAPTRLYGRPDDLRAFVDRAHALGLGVILDVVYNHLGPDGCYVSRFSDWYFSRKYENEWGDPLNFDREHSGPVREFFVENAGYWIDEFHIDGLRLDATQSIIDTSPVHVIGDIAERARRAAGPRKVYLVAENEPQETRLARPREAGGFGLDALWNDDFHHTAVVALTGRREAYYTDYGGTPQEFISAAKRGYLYQGQWYSWQQKARGESTSGMLPYAFVTCLENHDQVANGLRGARMHQQTSPSLWRALTALLLLGPGTPMLFQGQEFAASAPFTYFADHAPPLGEAVRAGRYEFLAQFPSVLDAAARRLLQSPGDRETFERCKLDPAERARHEAALALHRDLIALRRRDVAIAAAARGAVDGAVLSANAFVLRYFGGDAGDRLLLVNLGPDFRPATLPEPLLAPPGGGLWVLEWSSEDPAYGGNGTPATGGDERGWLLPGSSALYMRAEER
ncbi:MAG TPA: malto-oligosyltrehalose trehalohydrolase [Vicinamibacterales bacterium]|nr:malto-oligosyltrehalose trehalohydrolase [Vicinamibacterales bacterium]